MSKLLVIEDDAIIERILKEIAKDNITIIDKTALVQNTNILKYKNITLDVESYEVFRNNKKVFLTFKEFEILKLLMENPNKVFTRNNLLNSIWNYDYYGDEKIVNTHIMNIRRKLGNNVIKTVRGAGYKL